MPFTSLLLVFALSGHAMSDPSFKVHEGNSGQPLCAKDSPSTSVSLNDQPSQRCIPACVLCGWECTMEPNCIGFNVKNDANVCEIYFHQPGSFGNISGCSYYKNPAVGPTTVKPVTPSKDEALVTDPMTTIQSSAVGPTTVQPGSSITKSASVTDTMMTPYHSTQSSSVRVTTAQSNSSLILRNDYAGSSSGFFNRPKTQYQQGFGNTTSLYWIGLDRLHQLTQGHCQVRFDLQDRDGTWHYAQYSIFSVGDSSKKYELTIGGYSGDAGDAMRYSNGQQFTTYDADNDGWGGNCASSIGGGFWYDDCGAAWITTSTTSSNVAWSILSSNFRWYTTSTSWYISSSSWMSLNVVEVSLLC